MLLCGALRCGVGANGAVLPCATMCDNVLQSVTISCSAQQCVAVCCSVLQCVALLCLALWRCYRWRRATLCCRELQYVAVCCSVLLCSLVTEQTVLFVGDGLLADVLWRARGAVAAVC